MKVELPSKGAREVAWTSFASSFDCVVELDTLKVCTCTVLSPWAESLSLLEADSWEDLSSSCFVPISVISIASAFRPSVSVISFPVRFSPSKSPA